jgi:hypothetical protein
VAVIAEQAIFFVGKKSVAEQEEFTVNVMSSEGDASCSCILE